MTTRPQHRSGPMPGAHGRPRLRPRLARPAQAVSVAVLGGLLAAVALQDVPTGAGRAPAPPRAEAQDRVASAPPAAAAAEPTTGASAPAVLPDLRPTGVADPGSVPAPLALPETPAPPAALVPPARAALDLGLHPVDDPASPWVVVNKALPVAPAGWAPATLTTVAGYQVRPEVAGPLEQMLAAASADGVALTLRSAFRSYDDQVRVHADLVARVGQQHAEEVSARPGHSEHQTGLAVDVGSTTRPDCDFQDCFGDTAEGRWVAARAGEFGFVVRYTAANRAVTGYAPEGWHLRWVGTELVAELERRGVTTLEEVFGLPGGPDYP
ncbi:D-alanyl-D-alanine carboxypeptidase family protein [Cellulomonas sp. GbtcB1]|uniref:M15 family metallopeptidase n=1 Tax=Cellulomonas sp. GbtcB1 TaxID=2824746 RepID=UPI001C306327|nr:M15 family metallopeptidase [Cellulomonas sp. GbtcB1]